MVTSILRATVLRAALPLAILGWAIPASAQVTPFMQAVAEASAQDRDVADFYRDADYADIWTGPDDAPRLTALLRAVAMAGQHGLPEGRYSEEKIRSILSTVADERGRGDAEVALSRLFLAYARDVQTGVLKPSQVDPDIKREVPLRSRTALLSSFAGSEPVAFLRALPPRTEEYTRLLREKLILERVIDAGGWGPRVDAQKVRSGEDGPAVVALRNRLIRMGYLGRTAIAVFDDDMRAAVTAFQEDHGLTADGVPGPDTLGEVNVGVEDRLSAIIVALERERWLNLPEGRGARHVWVNLPDFRARIYDDGKITFETKAVVGARTPEEKRTPEFSDMMEYMEINPDWTVPRSILGRDYLPKMQANPFAAPYLDVIDARGRTVPRQYINFAQYTERTFPFTLRQAPGQRNALGTVKFMFPNPYAIYLHDTPDRHLFGAEVRTFSSGCIRLNDPHDFAYALLRRQMSDPEPYFQKILNSRKQTNVSLKQPIPVHLDYRTAFTGAKGRVQYRRDMYGRDATIWNALRGAGVELPAVRS